MTDISRYKNIIGKFTGSFPGEKEFMLFRAPGRVNLIGEHTDYNGLPVFPMAIDRDVSICASARSDSRVIIKNVDPSFGDREFESSPEIPSYPPGDWGNYCKAAVQAIQNFQNGNNRGGVLKGFNAVVEGNIPTGSGLSSSSALVVAMAVVTNAVNGLNIDPLTLAELLSAGERYVGTEGGGMDQAASLSGKKGHAMKIDFFPLRVEHIRFPERYAVVVCNSLVEAKKSGGAKDAYNQRVIECRLGAALIKKHIETKFGAECPIVLLGDLKKTKYSGLFDTVEALVDQLFTNETYTLKELSRILKIDEESILRTYLTLKDGSYFPEPDGGLRIKKRVRHVFTEALRVEKSRAAIEQHRMAEFGGLMNDSHRSATGDYEISCHEVDNLVDIARDSGALGSRITGAGFGGCTVNLVEEDKVEEFTEKVIDGYYRDFLHLKKADCLKHIFVCKPDDGAARIANDETKRYPHE